MLTDMAILERIGENLKSARLKQNITQQSLSEAASVSLSSIKKIEKGEHRVSASGIPKLSIRLFASDI